MVLEVLARRQPPAPQLVHREAVQSVLGGGPRHGARHRCPDRRAKEQHRASVAGPGTVMSTGSAAGPLPRVPRRRPPGAGVVRRIVTLPGTGGSTVAACPTSGSFAACGSAPPGSRGRGTPSVAVDRSTVRVAHDGRGRPRRIGRRRARRRVPPCRPPGPRALRVVLPPRGPRVRPGARPRTRAGARQPLGRPDATGPAGAAHRVVAPSTARTNTSTRCSTRSSWGCPVWVR